jgi:hypothetical protein
MQTKRVETKVYTEHIYCECGGEMKYEEPFGILSTYPPIYYHICNKCRAFKNYQYIYPRIVYEEVEA